MGRPAKPAEQITGHMTRTQIETRKITENVFASGIQIDAPEHLTDAQRRLFDAIADELVRCAVISNLDVYMIADAAIAIDRLTEYDRLIASEPRLLRDREVIGNRAKVASEFFRCCGELCLSPQARAKIGVAAANAKAEAEDPILKVLGGGAVD